MQFKGPRFVYEDGFESTELFKLFRHGRIVGYRISPQLIIHTDVVTNCLKHNVDDMCDYCGGFLLDSRSIHTLRKNWNAVSLMRQLIGDKPLPEPYFWYMAENGDIASTHYQQDVDEENPVISNLILRL